MLWLVNSVMCAQDAGDYLTIVGMVKDSHNKKSLENVNVSVQGTNVGTVTNAEGKFTLRVNKKSKPGFEYHACGLYE